MVPTNDIVCKKKINILNRVMCNKNKRKPSQYTADEK